MAPKNPAPKEPTLKTLVVVESPTKAKTLKRFLPKAYTVVACNGHVRDLPQSAKDIPEKYKKEPWSRLGVDVERGYKPLYLVPKNKTKIVSDLNKLVKDTELLLLATDEDREGESISWHLLELLRPKVPVKRMVFHEITKEAILSALEQTRELDDKLVKAQETRRVLDRLVGYTVSPLLWNKIAFGLSAGRVQSAAVELVVARERERMSFIAAKYCSVLADLEKSSKGFEARLTDWQGKRIASGKDFDETTGKLPPGKDLLVLDPKNADELITKVKAAPWKVEKVDEKVVKRNPSPPFITSTLQQEANRKLGWGARDTMRVAQALYEQGFITYMRTDSTSLSSEALAAARDCILDKYGKDYVPDAPREFRNKDKMAQEAHEAIRPAGRTFKSPEETGLLDRELVLYDLIWKRTVASQMAEASQKRVAVTLEAGGARFVANGSELTFPGFLRAYVEGSDDPMAALEERDVILPPMVVGDRVDMKDMRREDHETKPPARYTEASLVQKMEKEGIGRPSTYASTISTVIDRGYVVKVGPALVPTFTAFAVTALLEKNFPDLVDLRFTAEMEKSLDQIAEGQLDHLPYLEKFYKGLDGLVAQVKKAEKAVDSNAARTVDLGRDVGFDVKIGKFGPYFIKDNDKGEPVHGSIPESVHPSDLTRESAKELIESSARGPNSLGVDPTSSKKVYLLSGRFGPYIQLGLPREDAKADAAKKEPEPEPVIEYTKTGKPKKPKKPKKAPVERPKIVGLPKGVEPKDVTLELALKLLTLPRTLGAHPESGKDIKAGLGRFGPYVVHDGDFRSLKKEDDVITVELPRALELFAEPKGRGRSAKKVLRELGKLGETPVQLLEGKYGPYVSDGKRNASLREGMDPTTLTMEQATGMLDEKSPKKRTSARRR